MLNEGVYGNLNWKVSDYYKNKGKYGGYESGGYIIDMDSILWINYPNWERKGIIEWKYDKEKIRYSKYIPLSDVLKQSHDDPELYLTSCQVEEAKWELLHDQHYIVIQILNSDVEKKKEKIDNGTRMRVLIIGLNKFRKLEIKEIVDDTSPKALGIWRTRELNSNVLNNIGKIY